MRWDLLVVGAGHAGVEAAAAAARMGASVCLVTLSRESIGHMPCNPAVGGIGKAHLSAEIDALGGVQAWAADRAGVMFKTLNLSRGPAVWGPRISCDKAVYRQLMRRLVEGLRGLEVVEGEATGLLSGEAGVEGVVLADGRSLRAVTTLLTTGTFLGGLLHTGGESRPGGRIGEAPSLGLGDALRKLGLETERFKTGTPPRIARSSLDLDALELGHGDAEPEALSWRTSWQPRQRASSWMVRTGAQLKILVEDNLHRSPLYAGRIAGVGPRYCPSIEDKIVRFPHHESHTIFLEAETLGGESIYVNGLSTSLPVDVQEQMLRSLAGLARAEILRPGYAVEYDVVPAVQVEMDFRARGIPGLCLAGQLLGSSGYEEAAAQGFLAGVNAVLSQRSEAPLVFGRDQGYLGVLVSDLTSRRHPEPYRMLSSRAEHRLRFGVDTARERFMARGVELGLVDEKVFHVERRRWERRRELEDGLVGRVLNPDSSTRQRLRVALGIELKQSSTAAVIASRKDVCAEDLPRAFAELEGLSPRQLTRLVGRLRSAEHVSRLEREHQRVERLRERALPVMEWSALPGLSNEVVELLRRHAPATLAAAEAIPGMTPSALSILAAQIDRHQEDRR